MITQSKQQLLPLLVENVHEKPFRKLVANLSTEELTATILHLYDVNQLGASKLHEALWQQAVRLGAAATVRNTVASLDGQGADSVLEHLLSGNLDDLSWILNAPELATVRRRQLLTAVLRNATELNWSMLGPIYGQVLNTLSDEPEVATDVIVKLLAEGWRDSAAAFKALLAVLPQLDQQLAQELCGRFVPWIMQLDERHRAHSDVEMLIETAGSSLDAGVTYQAALGRNLSSDLVEANLLVLSSAKSVGVRKSLVMSIERLARGILDRGQFDLSVRASSYAADLLWAARDQNFWEHFRAATSLLPFLLRERGEASSPLIAAAFPAVYTELKKENAAPDIFKLFFFVDWDRCKAMRIDLIEAFFSSKWRPTDIALTAARTGDELKFFRRISRHDNGPAVIAAIESGLDDIPGPWNDITKRAIANLDAK